MCPSVSKCFYFSLWYLRTYPYIHSFKAKELQYYNRQRLTNFPKLDAVYAIQWTHDWKSISLKSGLNLEKVVHWDGVIESHLNPDAEDFLSDGKNNKTKEQRLYKLKEGKSFIVCTIKLPGDIHNIKKGPLVLSHQSGIQKRSIGKLGYDKERRD